jgi:hypothetical protein
MNLRAALSIAVGMKWFIPESTDDRSTGRVGIAGS